METAEIKFTIAEEIAEIKRELALRAKCYPRWSDGASAAKKAQLDRQIAIMKQILNRLLAINKEQSNQSALW